MPEVFRCKQCNKNMTEKDAGVIINSDDGDREKRSIYCKQCAPSLAVLYGWDRYILQDSEKILEELTLYRKEAM